MTTTTFVPDWEATPELAEIRANTGWLKINGFRGFAPECKHRYDDYVIEVRERYETMPPQLADVPMKAIVLTSPSSKVTRAVDDKYVEGKITARVETYVGDGGAERQHIRVEGTGVSLEKINNWFDDLVAGDKKDWSRRAMRDEGVRRAMDH